MCARELASALAPHIEGLLAEKRALGFSYDTEEGVLARFDAYCRDRELERPEITRDLLDGWLERSPTEGWHNHVKRVNAVRQLALYMASMGLEAHVPDLPSTEPQKPPYILTDAERSALFAQIDAWEPKAGGRAVRRLAGEYRMLFRLIYCCGLRNSEACGMPVARVDAEAGTLRVSQSKGRKDRIVYMADDLAGLLSSYLAWLRDALGSDPAWLFPAKDPKRPLPNTTVDNVFARFWDATGLGGGRSDRPVVHDLRFGFITDRTNLWALADVDVDAMMPYLSRYAGHANLQSTYYYIHTSERLRDVIAKYDVTGSSAIPEEVDYGRERRRPGRR